MKRQWKSKRYVENSTSMSWIKSKKPNQERSDLKLFEAFSAEPEMKTIKGKTKKHDKKWTWNFVWTYEFVGNASLKWKFEFKNCSAMSVDVLKKNKWPFLGRGVSFTNKIMMKHERQKKE